MNTSLIIAIAGILTLVSIIMKFTKSSMENMSIFLQIRKKSVNIKQTLTQRRKIEGDENIPQRRFMFAISDWFSTLAIVTVSSILFFEYSVETLTHESLLHIAFLFSLLLFNIIIIAVSTIERRLGYWIDEFNSTIEQLLKLIPSSENKEDLIKSQNPTSPPLVKRKKRKTLRGKK